MTDKARDKSDGSQTDDAAPPRDEAPAGPTRKQDPPKPKEVGGRSGPEPTRYGDWEVGGLASDF